MLLQLRDVWGAATRLARKPVALLTTADPGAGFCAECLTHNFGSRFVSACACNFAELRTHLAVPTTSPSPWRAALHQRKRSITP